MNFSENTQAILLLNAHFAKVVKGEFTPLTPTEWGNFASWLRDKELSPAQLLKADLSDVLASWHDRKVTTKRIQALLERGHAMALALEKWERAGIWVITRSDDAYPRRLKNRLRWATPAVFFGVGNRDLLNQSALAVVGSRNASAEDLYFSDVVGAQAASQGYALVSGGARGVDETAMLGALNAEGTAVGIMADSLLKAATSAKWRKHLMQGNLALISPFYPEAGFNTGNAMARNKYVYCMSDAALVAHSGTKGGTLTGALENLKKCWVPLWVKETNDPNAGNGQIVANGGRWFSSPAETIDIASMLFSTTTQSEQVGVVADNGHCPSNETPSLFSQPEAAIEPSETTVADVAKGIDVDSKADIQNSEATVDPAQTGPSDLLISVPNDEPSPEDISSSESPSLTKEGDQSEENWDNQSNQESLQPLFQLFLVHIAKLCAAPKTIDEISDDLGLHKSQTKAWLVQAEQEHKVEKLSRPVRYQWSVQESLEGIE